MTPPGAISSSSSSCRQVPGGSSCRRRGCRGPTRCRRPSPSAICLPQMQAVPLLRSPMNRTVSVRSQQGGRRLRATCFSTASRGAGRRRLLPRLPWPPPRQRSKPAPHVHRRLRRPVAAAAARLPHVGAVVVGSDRERQRRLLRTTGDGAHHRRQSIADGSADAAGYPTIVTMLDNYGGFADHYSEPGDMAIHNLLARLIADGPGVGMMTIITAKHPGDVPTGLRRPSPPGSCSGSPIATTTAGLVFRRSIRPRTGSCLRVRSGREVQVALAHEGVGAAVAEVAWPAPRNPPWRIDVLPSEVSITEFISRGRITTGEWYLPLGIGIRRLSRWA